MKSLIIFLVCAFSLNGWAKEVAANTSEICVSNFLSFMKMASSDTSGKFKKTIFSAKVDKELLEMSQQVSKLKDPINSDEAKKIFSKAKPIITKEVNKEFNQCVTMMDSVYRGIKQVCPNLSDKDANYQEKLNNCTKAAAELPDVKVDAGVWRGSVTKLFMQK